ncbi:hypothetical protein OSTOST_10416 [Ostertagia ostertagi]
MGKLLQKNYRTCTSDSKSQIIAMDEQEARLNAELQSFDKKMQEMEDQRNVYSDLDQLAADVENNIRVRRLRALYNEHLVAAAADRR